jgi:polyglycine hydrolase-like protein
VFDRTKAQFAADVAAFGRDSFVPFDWDVINMNGNVRYAGVFQHPAPGAEERWQIAMSPSSFGSFDAQAKAAGLRIADFEAYADENGDTRYAAIWVPAVGTADAVLVKDKTVGQLQAVLDQQRSHDRIPVDVDEYSIPGCQHCFASLWVKNVEHLGWAVWWNLDFRALTVKRNELEPGQRLVAITAGAYIDHDFPDPDDVTMKYAAVWLSDPHHRVTLMAQDKNKDTLVSLHNSFKGLGYRPQAFEAYPAEKSCSVFGGCVLTTNYAMIWRQNS